jgi:hypothetical protein
MIESLNKVGRCRLKSVEARVESAWFQRMKLKYDKPLSNHAFNFNLRRYIKEKISAGDVITIDKARRCRLNL